MKYWRCEMSWAELRWDGRKLWLCHMMLFCYSSNSSNIVCMWNYFHLFFCEYFNDLSSNSLLNIYRSQIISICFPFVVGIKYLYIPSSNFNQLLASSIESNIMSGSKCTRLAWWTYVHLAIGVVDGWCRLLTTVPLKRDWNKFNFEEY